METRLFDTAFDRLNAGVLSEISGQVQLERCEKAERVIPPSAGTDPNWDTRAGRIELAVLKLKQATFPQNAFQSSFCRTSALTAAAGRGLTGEV